jgi:hypothetical protein
MINTIVLTTNKIKSMKSEQLHNQDELCEMLKEYRKARNYNDNDLAVSLRCFFTDHLAFTIEEYEQNCFQLIELITDTDVSRKLAHPNDQIRMLGRLLDLLVGIQKEPERLYSYIDSGDMESGILPAKSLECISKRWNELYNHKS